MEERNITESAIRVIAYYLPQFHPVVENDEWWGAGFTEWTNVAAARRRYLFHRQPRIPADLGFYDLRLAETREAQARLARANGVEGFCYWHYWFGGRRLLERPFSEVLESGRPDFPFCLGWANESWTGIWYNAPRRVLVEQTYPGPADHQRHFEAVLPAFRDHRYIRVDDRPIFYVYRPFTIPNLPSMILLWRSMARAAGLSGLHLVAETPEGQRALTAGFDAFVAQPGWTAIARRRPLARKLHERIFRRPRVVHAKHMSAALRDSLRSDKQYPCVVPNWDNTPRSGRRGLIVKSTSPSRFSEDLKFAIGFLHERPREHRLLFIKSWNEWAEGNYLEPDQQNGHAYLEILRRTLVDPDE
jgi:lipopolysaccharide biosynthesis protein